MTTAVSNNDAKIERKAKKSKKMAFSSDYRSTFNQYFLFFIKNEKLIFHKYVQND